MTYKQGYFTMFYLLNKYYFEDTSNDDLAVLLGSMNPEIFIDNEAVSADPAYWADWERILNENEVIEPMSADNISDMIVAFLEFYQKEFEFNLSEIIEKIERLSSGNEILIECIKLAEAK